MIVNLILIEITGSIYLLRICYWQLSCNWKEITRIVNTQKVITTEGNNTERNFIQVRKCSELYVKLKELQGLLKIKPRPFVCSTQPETKAPSNAENTSTWTLECSKWFRAFCG